MMDPPRLRSRSGSLESLLLRSVPSFEPPPSAEEELWRRLKPLTAVGVAAAATGAGSHAAAAAAGSKLAGKALLFAAIKWGAVLAVAGPAVGLTTHWVLHRRAIAHATASTLAVPAAAPADVRPAIEAQPALATDVPAPVDVPRAPGPTPSHATTHGARSSAHSDEGAIEAPSALQAESRLLSSARSKYLGGDPSGALDDIARLSARFPHGKLAQEREVVAIDCLNALGNRQAMRARALAFLQRFPAGPYAVHVRQLIETP